MKLNVYSYESVTDFIIDSYRLLKESADFSVRSWATEMGFQSPVILSDVLKRKRPLKLKYLENFSKGLHLNEKEVIFLKTIYFYEKSSGEQKEYFVSLMDSLKPVDSSIAMNGGLFSHWLNVIIYKLGQIKGDGMTFSDIKKSLKEDVPVSLIANSLELLTENGLVNFDGSHYKITQENDITTPNDILIKSSHTYYKQVISKASNSVELDVNEREFQCFAVGMKKEDLTKAKEIVRKARLDIAELHKEDANSVYQFNLNGYLVAEV